jgi:hypothetical protein
MNKQLTSQIINHIFSNLLIINASDFNINKFKSIKSTEHLLPETISFAGDSADEETINKIWGIQLSIDGQKLKMLLANCSVDPNILEYALLIKMQDTPAYGVYGSYNKDYNNFVIEDPLIAVCMDNQNWMQCNTYLQATFLAAMENIKDLPYTLEKCQDYKAEYNSLLSFIKYYDFLYEDNDEGQKM